MAVSEKLVKKKDRSWQNGKYDCDGPGFVRHSRQLQLQLQLQLLGSIPLG